MGRQAILEWMAECIPQVHLLSVSSCTQFWFVTAVPKCLNSDTLSKDLLCICPAFCSWYTGCNRRNVQDFGRVFLRSNYTDITQNTYIQSWTVMEIMAIEMCGLLGCWRTVCLSWCHTCPMRLPGTRHGNAVTLASVLQSAAACGKVLGSLRTTMTRVRVYL